MALADDPEAGSATIAGARRGRSAAIARLPCAPSVLIASSTRSGAPRVAMAFAELGCHVEAICWFRGPMARTSAVRRLHRYSPLRPLAALRRALARAQPDLVVPCDDRAVSHLLALHDQLVAAGEHAPAAVIARSIGDVRDGARRRGPCRLRRPGARGGGAGAADAGGRRMWRSCARRSAASACRRC